MPLKPVPQDTAAVSPWEDASSFHTKTRESTTVSVTFRLPQSSARGIAKIVQSGKFPDLETNSDAFRDAIWRWLAWMADITQDEVMKNQLEVQRAQWRLEAELEKLHQLSSTVDTAEKLLEEDNHGESTRRRVLTELSSLSLKIEDSALRRRIIELVMKYR